MIEINNKQYQTYEISKIDKSKYIGFIYITINKINNKKYIGQHIRWKENYFGSGRYILSSIKKYGLDNFERFIIDLAVSQQELNEKEEYYINEVFNAVKLEDWYNIKDGAQNGGNTRAGYTIEQLNIWKSKISMNSGKPMLGKIFTLEHRKKISVGRKGISVSEETKKRMSKNNIKYWKGCKKEDHPRYGKTFTEESKKKMSESNKGNRYRAKQITVFKNGEFFNEYSSIFDFAKDMGAKFSDDNIGRSAKKLAHGWIPTRGLFVGFSAELKKE